MVSIKRSIAEVGSWVGLVAIVGSMFAYTKSTTFPGAAAAVPVLGTAAIIFFNTSHLTASGRLLAAKPLVGIGLISYSLYLWHWPIFVFLRYVKVDVTPPYFMGACLLSFFLAWLSYRFVEQPFRKKSLCQSTRSMFTFATAYLAVMIATGIWFWQAKGIPSRFPNQYAIYLADAHHTGEEYQTKLQDLLNDRLIRLGSDDQNPTFLVGRQPCNGRVPSNSCGSPKAWLGRLRRD